MEKITPMRLIKTVTETRDNKLSYISFKKTTYITAFHHMKKITLLIVSPPLPLWLCFADIIFHLVQLKKKMIQSTDITDLFEGFAAYS